MVFQAGFAIIAKSQSMLADSEAMSVDAMTYLLNLIAERIKHTPYSAHELQLTAPIRHYRRELLRLYLEFLPPLISVITLMMITIVVLQKSLATLRHDYPPDGGEEVEDDDVSLPIMLVFSSGNLLLDMLNVTCFARAHNAFGLQAVERETPSSLLPPDDDDDDANQNDNPSYKTATNGNVQVNHVGQDNRNHDTIHYKEDEETSLLWRQGDRTTYASTTSTAPTITNPHLSTLDSFRRRQHDESERSMINLNMCSAWTVRAPTTFVQFEMTIALLFVLM